MDNSEYISLIREERRAHWEYRAAVINQIDTSALFKKWFALAEKLKIERERRRQISRNQTEGVKK